MPKVTVIPIRREAPLSDADRAVADYAYNLWLSSAFRGGSPEKALLTATQLLSGATPARLFVVPKRGVNVYPLGDLNERRQ